MKEKKAINEPCRVKKPRNRSSIIGIFLDSSLSSTTNSRVKKLTDRVCDVTLRGSRKKLRSLTSMPVGRICSHIFSLTRLTSGENCVCERERLDGRNQKMKKEKKKKRKRKKKQKRDKIRYMSNQSMHTNQVVTSSIKETLATNQSFPHLNTKD